MERSYWCYKGETHVHLIFKEVNEPLCCFLPRPQMCWLPTEGIGSVSASIRLCQMHPQQHIKCGWLPRADCTETDWVCMYGHGRPCMFLVGLRCVSRRLIFEVVLNLFIVHKYIYLFIYLFKLICVLFTCFIYWKDSSRDFCFMELASNLGLIKLCIDCCFF